MTMLATDYKTGAGLTPADYDFYRSSGGFSTADSYNKITTQQISSAPKPPIIYTPNKTPVYTIDKSAEVLNDRTLPSIDRNNNLNGSLYLGLFSQSEFFILIGIVAVFVYMVVK